MTAPNSSELHFARCCSRPSNFLLALNTSESNKNRNPVRRDAKPPNLNRNVRSNLSCSTQDEKV